MTKVISLDFELASTLDLTDTGADVWTKSKHTLPILCGFALDFAEPEVIAFDNLTAWMQPPPRPGASTEGPIPLFLRDKLLDAIEAGAEIHAWNANFEFNVWNNICAPRFGWPRLPIERFHCTMCAAACAGLPMSLDEAAGALNSPYRKDKAGQALMMRMARPRRIDPDGTIHWWHIDDKAKLQQLIDYNKADVRAEREVHLRIPRMTKRERAIWLVDQRMNMRGLPVDCELLTALHGITLQELLRLNQQIHTLTNGAVTGSTVNVKLLAWAKSHGYPRDTLEKDTLSKFLRAPEFKLLNGATRGVLAARAEAAKTSTAKLVSIGEYARLDGQARNLVQYGGAVRTLRWAGRGPQIQNFPRPVVKHVKEAVEEILQGMDAEGLRILFGRPLDVISSCLRGVFKAPEGKLFAVCDYHAIEVIVLGWLADFDELLQVFRLREEDVYVFTARSIGSNDRQLGKVLRLACGYNMGHVKFRETANNPPYNLDLTLAQAHRAVQDFRHANAPIVSLWHACESCAGNAILNPTTTYTFKRLKFRMANPKGRLAGALLMELPSGRNLVYRNARVQHGRIIFWGVNQYTRRWQELDTYGGKLVENATQAVARDLLADAITVIDHVWPDALCTTVHDEIVAMTTEEAAPTLLASMKNAMINPPTWGAGLPLSAAGAVVDRYCKL